MALLSLEAFVVLSVSTLIFQAQINGTIRRCLKARHKPANVTLLVHIGTVMVEVLRYYARGFSQPAGAEIHADILDVTFMAIQSLTSFQLARDRGFMGHKSVLRPVYHAQNTCRIFLSFFSFVLDKPWMHRGSIMIAVSFIYPRLFIWTACRLRVLALQRYGDIYTAAMFIGALIAMHDSGLPMGPQVFLGVFVAFALLERWVARKLLQRMALEQESSGQKACGRGGDGNNKNNNHLAKQVEDFVVDMLYEGGFVEMDLLKASGSWPKTMKTASLKACAQGIAGTRDSLPVEANTLAG